MDFPGSTPFNGEHRRNIFPSCACAFLDDDPAYECSTNPLTGSLPTCRRSPRLLSNGYYVLTEDSFLSDEEGNITLTPSHTSVTYKENLFRVFRRRKKIRRSLDSLFNLSASSSWLSSTIPSRMDFSPVEDPWLDRCRKLEASHSDIGDSDFSSEYNNHVSQRQIPESNGAFLTKDDEFIHFEEPFCASKSCSSFMINANEETWSNAESRTVQNVFSQMVALIMCLTISVCTRYFLGGLSATLLLMILVCLDQCVSSTRPEALLSLSLNNLALSQKEAVLHKRRTAENNKKKEQSLKTKRKNQVELCPVCAPYSVDRTALFISFLAECSSASEI